jgi:regulator of protease activity HflC (stomatin/prohibitin superfamily)
MCYVCVSEMDRGLVEKLGEFDRVLEPGCSCLVPCTEQVSGMISLKCRAIPLRVDTKTKDNVLVVVACAVHYEVMEDRVRDAYYRFSNPSGQISSYAGNVIRGEVPKMTIDELFTSRDEIQIALKRELDVKMADFGFNIVATLIIDIDPIDAIKQAMSQINTNARMRQAMSFKSDAEKIEIIKAAEGDAEAKRLSGVGLAEQRKAATAGLQQSVENFQHGVKGIKAKEVMSLLLMNQYFDALKDIATQGRGTVVFTAGDGGDDNVTSGMMAANAGRPSRGGR